MTENIWDHLKHFSIKEKNIYGQPAWADPYKMCGITLRVLDEITDRVKKYAWEKYKKRAYCLIHCAYDNDGHVKNSEHYKGNAIDYHFTVISLYEAIVITKQVLKEMKLFNIVGLGFYLDWANQGFHLDCRGFYARWARRFKKKSERIDKNNKKETVYISFDEGIKILSRKEV